MASRSCSSAITTATAITSSRSAPLNSRAPGTPAFTEASSVARHTKLPIRNPSASTSSATRKRGTKRKNSCTRPWNGWSWSASTAETMKPIQTSQNTIFATSTWALGHLGDAQHLAGADPRRQALEAEPCRAAAATARRASAATRSPSAKMMVAATSLGTNCAKAVAKLRHDWASASAIS